MIVKHRNNFGFLLLVRVKFYFPKLKEQRFVWNNKFPIDDILSSCHIETCNVHEISFDGDVFDNKEGIQKMSAL
jgi:hypothetical protein